MATYWVPDLPKIKGQMQWNLDNFSFLKKPSWKSQLYQQEAESTLKNKFCANCSDTKPLKTWKSDNFQDLHVNELEMAALGVETKL